MNKIKHPLRVNMRGDAIKALHAALEALFGAPPAAEKRMSRYGRGTNRLVAQLQQEYGLRPVGFVDDQTANTINRLLKERGFLDDQDEDVDRDEDRDGPGRPDEDADTRRITISGIVTDEHGAPARAEIGVKRLAFRREHSIGRTRTGANGAYTITVKAPEGVSLRVDGKLADQTLRSEPFKVGRDAVQIDLTAAPVKIMRTTRFDIVEAAVRPVIGDLALSRLRETEQHDDISFLARDRELDPQLLAKTVIAHRIGEAEDLPPAAIFAFLDQNGTAGLPTDLVAAQTGEEEAEALDARILRDIAAMSEKRQRRTLEAATRGGNAPYTLNREIDRVVEHLQGRRTALLADAPVGVGKVSLNRLLGETALNARQKQRFIELQAEAAESGARLWDRVAADQSFDAQAQRDLRTTFLLGSFSKNHTPFIAFAKTALPPEIVEEPGRAAAYSRDDWRALLRQGVANQPEILPENIDGDDEEDRIAVFAQMLMERAERNFPVAATVGRINERRDVRIENFDAVQSAVFKVPDLDLAKLNIKALRLGRSLEDQFENPGATLKASAELVAGLDEGAASDLMRIQRAMRLAPGAAAAAGLLATGYDSAFRIHEAGRSLFIADVQAAGLNPLEAVRAHARAEAAYGYLMARFLEYRGDLDKAAPAAIAGRWSSEDLVAELTDDPSLRTLFGSLDSCACEWCESVHGPAAYFTDILRWLRHRRARPGSGFSDALAVLQARRPDLLELLLNCENADTLMPYIDLTNEVLEEAVSPSGASRQTTLRSELLMAEPEHVNTDAYTVLAGAEHAMGLPFDLPDAEAQIYLAHLQLTRETIMSAIQSGPVPADSEIAAARFGLSSGQAAIITTPAPGRQDVFWSYSAPGELVPTASCRTLMARADISYEDLAELLATRFINGQSPRSSFHPEFECDLDERQVANLSAERLDRMNRFIRLWRTLGWAIHEVDAALHALGGVLDGPALAGLMKLDRLRVRLRLSVEEAAAMAAPLDVAVRDHLTGDGRVIYTDLFQNPAVQNPPDPELAVSAVTAATPPARIEQKLELIAASLPLSEDDLSLLAPEVADPDIALPVRSERTTLEALSQLYRFARLARALRIGVSELLTFCRISGAPLDGDGKVDPFQSVDSLTGFMEQFDRHAASGLSAAQSRHVITAWADTPLGASEPDLESRASELRAQLADIRAETLTAPEERAAALERQLAGVPGFADAALRAEAIAIIEDSYAGALADRNAFITAHFGALMPVPDAIAAFAPYAGPPAGRDAAIDARRLTALDAIYAVLARAAVTSTVAGWAGLEASAAEPLAWTLTRGGGDPLGVLALEPAFLERTADDSAYVLAATRADMPDLFAMLALIDKIAFVADALDWSGARLGWMLENLADHGGPDLSALPLEAADPAAGFDAWLAALRWTAVFDAHPETPDARLSAIVDALGSPGYDLASFAADYAAWTGREADVIAGLVLSLGLSFPSDMQSVEAHERLLEGLRLVRLAGVSPARLAGWAAPAVTAAAATEIKLAAKARYDLDTWLEIAAPLQDRLREAKRVALLTYLTSRPASAGPSWPDSNAVMAHFLVDPEMTACRKTSRLVQATGSVQMFVERCLMNLEPDVVADADADEDWLHWDYMQHYRVWEAARKVFLWPENVLRPELNADKSPALVQLERNLSQSMLDAASAEKAVETYLHDLDAMARLDVLAMHEDTSGPDRIIHVLAAGKGEPRPIYYRKRIFPKDAAAAYWTAWEKLDLEIPGDAVFGVVDRKLHIFWLNLVEETNPTQVPPPAQASDDPPPDPMLMWKITPAWSQLRQGAWSAPRTGGRTLTYTEFRPRATFHLKTSGYSRGRMALNVYVSTSEAFNERRLRVWIPGTGYDDVHQDPSQTYHMETIEPIHVARFVIKRDVEEIQLTDRNSLYTDQRSGAFGPEAADIARLRFPNASLLRPWWMTWRRQRIHARGANEGSRPGTGDLVVLKGSGPARRVQEDELLEAVPKPFYILPPGNRAMFDSRRPFFFADSERAFFVRPTTEWRVDHSFTTEEPSLSGMTQYRVTYRFDRFYHPHTDFFLDELGTGGLKRFYRRATQLSAPRGFNFETYEPDALVTPDHQYDVVDFKYAGAYSQYNWELFLHVPWLIANRLSGEQRFDDALAFLRHVFDPTNASADPAPQRYWITKPFHQMGAADYNAQRIERLMQLVNSGSATHVAQVEQWRDDPFDPHKLARLRPTAYQRAVVMAYIDLLMDWGEREFRAFTTESLNRATLYFSRAAQLLGPRPETVPVDRRMEAKTFSQVEADLDAFGNVLAEVENILPEPPPGGSGSDEPLPPITLFYFCIPGNSRLLDYWDRLERNLFNLRNCRDIDGVERPLPLFAPPIDPAMLVRAAAAGVDLSTLAFGAGAALPHYRFRYIIQRAYAFTSEVERLGGALLSALERRDEAELARLREDHVRDMHEQMVAVRELRIEEAKTRLDELKAAKERAKIREKYWSKKAGMPMNAADVFGISLKGISFIYKTISVGLTSGSSVAHVTPKVQAGAAGVGGSPVATTEVAGEQVYGALDKAGKALKTAGEILDKAADLSFKIGSFIDKASKYSHKAELAAQELEVAEKDILVGEARIAAEEGELAAEKRRIEHAEEAYTFLKDRYTGQELYEWMISQISTVYFQAYQTAFDMAQAAAACAEREVELTGSNYIKFGYWDSLRKGLMTGEALAQDLRRLESAYIDRNRRRYEITKDISLALLDAEALLTLRATGQCEFEAPETLFDADHPGHYNRRIKSVAITIPTVAGPYTSVNAKLVLLSDHTRVSTSLAPGYARTSMTDDARFIDNRSMTRAIVTSKAQDDPGVFELNLEDDRYLPFEGAGAISRWRLELPADTNAFDLHQVSDAIVHIRYTAEEGGETLAEAARLTASQIPVRQSAQIVRLDQAFAAGFADLTSPPTGGGDQQMEIAFTSDRLPYLDRIREVTVTKVMLAAPGAAEDLVAEVTAPGGAAATVNLIPDPGLDNVRSGDTTGAFAAGVALGDFTLKLRLASATDFQSLTDGDLSALYAIFLYDAEQ